MSDYGSKPDFNSVLQNVLSNPQLLSNIASMINGSSANTATEASQNEAQSYKAPELPQAPSEREDAVNAISTSPSQPAMPSLPVFAGGRHNSSKEKALLVALKPFLPSRKCQTIDTVIRLLDIVSLVGGIK